MAAFGRGVEAVEGVDLTAVPLALVGDAVAVDEAVELAKLYGSERSPAFVNGVLDKMARRIRDAGQPLQAQAAPQIDITAEIPDLPDYTPPA